MVQSLMCTYYMVHMKYDKWQHNLVYPRDTITFKQEEEIGFRKESAQGGSWFPAKGSPWEKAGMGGWDSHKGPEIRTGSVSMAPSVFSGGHFLKVSMDREGTGRG